MSTRNRRPDKELQHRKASRADFVLSSRSASQNNRRRKLNQRNSWSRLVVALVEPTARDLGVRIDIGPLPPGLHARADERHRPPDVGIEETEDVIRRRLEVYAEQTAPLTSVRSRRSERKRNAPRASRERNVRPSVVR